MGHWRSHTDSLHFPRFAVKIVCQCYKGCNYAEKEKNGKGLQTVEVPACTSQVYERSVRVYCRERAQKGQQAGSNREYTKYTKCCNYQWWTYKCVLMVVWVRSNEQDILIMDRGQVHTVINWSLHRPRTPSWNNRCLWHIMNCFLHKSYKHGVEQINMHRCCNFAIIYSHRGST
jgi:hypothetical protein